MNDATTPPTPLSEPHPEGPLPDPSSPAPSPKRPWTILGRLSKAVREQNWFAVVLEVCIVVLGVVIGFQVTAWGQERGDRAKEQRYLHQLHADLVETERLVSDADSIMHRVDADGARLVRAFFLPERPPADSIVDWFSGASGVRDARPVMGTVEALVATGDLALLRNDTLRSAVTAYLDDSRKALRIHDNDVERWVDALLAFRRRLDPAALDEERVSPGNLDSLRQSPLWTLPAGARRNPFPLDVETLLSDRDAYAEVKQMHLNKETLRTMRSWMLRDARALREQVEAELNR